MPRRGASITQADIARALRAAQAAGPKWYVEILPGGNHSARAGRNIPAIHSGGTGSADCAQEEMAPLMQPMPRDPTAPIQPDPTAPMRLAHAAAMFGLTVSALRTEAKRGRLAISRVAGKDFVTKAEIERMFERCQLAPVTGPRETEKGSPNAPSTDRAHAAALATMERLKAGLPVDLRGKDSGRPRL